MRSTIAVILFLLPAYAQAQTPAQQGAKTRDLSLPLHRMLEINRGLAGLDRYERVVKDGERERIVADVYKFAPGLRIVIMKNMIALRPMADGFDREQQALLASVSGAEKAGTAEARRFSVELQKLLDVPQSVTLLVITEAELRLADNAIPPSVLATLAPILDLSQ